MRPHSSAPRLAFTRDGVIPFPSPLQLKTGGTGTLELPTMAQRVVAFSVKADAVDKDARTFEGIAAIWTKDLGDDIIHKGAFKETIKTWKSSGEGLPLLNSHDHWDIFSAVGQLMDAKETEEGLWTKWEVIDGPDGDAVLARLRPSKRTGRAVIGKMSIGYEPVKWEMENSDTARFGQIRHLKVVNLKEVSLVLFPMAPGASIDGSTVKHMLSLADQTEPAKLDAATKEDLRRLASKIGKLLSPKGKKTEDAPDTGSSDTPPAPDAGAAEETPPAETPETTDDDGTSGDPAPSAASSDTPAATGEGSPSAAEGTSAGEPSAPSGEKAGDVYLYGEALQQRLRTALFKSKVSDLKQNTNSTQS